MFMERAKESAGATGKELEEGATDGGRAELAGREGVGRSGARVAAAIDLVVAALQLADVIRRDFAPAQTDEIQPAQSVAIGDRRERRNVIRRGAIPSQNHTGSNPRVLMHAGAAAQKRLGFDPDVAGEEHRIRQNHLLRNVTVVGNVRIGHQIDVVGDHRAPSGHGRPMNRHALAHHDVISRHHAAHRLDIESEVLRIPTDNRETVDPVVAPEDCPSPQHDVFSQHRAIPDLDTVTDDAESADDDVLAKAHIAPDDRRLVDGH
jgi:hypothetical protein